MSVESEPGRSCRTVALGNGAIVPRAPHGRRIAARVIDIVASTLPSLAVILVIAIISIRDALGSGEDGGAYVLLLGLLVLGVMALYEPARIARKGCTLGKHIAGIKMVDAHDGSVPSGRKALVRWMVTAVLGMVLFWAVSLMIGVVLLVVRDDVGTNTAISEGFNLGVFLGSGLVFGLMFGAPLAWLLLWLVSLAGSSGRGLHDRAAGTIVIAATTPERR